MESTLKREIGLAQRHNNPLSVILLDIDHFKKINDHYGHLHGDQVLAKVAQCAKETIRDSDIIFRYGGEEFLILLTNTSLDGACLLGERIRNEIMKLQMADLPSAKVTVSLGVATLHSGDEQQNFIDRADKALYQAKEKGRNRVICL